MEGATHYTTSILLRQLPSFHGPNSNVWTDNSAASNVFSYQATISFLHWFLVVSSEEM
jgi:hypothetical protein